MTHKNKKKKKNNEGFSLIEVLLAVVLLGLIAAPIFQIFYSSYTLNLKSKKYLAAADLMQTVMEGISAQTWEDSKTADGNVTVSGLEKYYTTGEIVELDASNRKVYYIPSTAYASFTAPTGTMSTPDTSEENKIKITYSGVNYSGYTFNVIIQFDVGNKIGATKYYTVPTTVSIYDSTNSHLLETAETNVINKR